MGDFYKRYFGHPTWQCLEDLKKNRPNTEIAALLVSQTTPALSLVDYHPYIDKIIRPKIHLKDFKKRNIEKFIGDYKMLSPKIANKFELKKPPIYMSDKDKEYVDKITSTYKNIVCLHPFAGDRYGLNTRKPLHVQEYIPIIQTLIGKGFTVVMLGKTWERIQPGIHNIRSIEEDFKWKADGFVNLINKTNVRTGAEIVRRAGRFVGTASSFMCAAWSMDDVRTAVITPQAWKKPLEEMPWAQNKINDPRHKMIYLNHDRTPNKLKEVADATSEWFK
jgi:ADP-heptose:LPS heptosyltransferase